MNASCMACARALTALCGLVAMTAAFAYVRSTDLAACDDQRDHGLRDEAKRCYRALTRTSRDAGVRAEAFWALGEFKAANRMFAEAVRERAGSADLRARWGRLYLDTHQPGDAMKLFDEALELDSKHVEARLGTVLVMLQGFEPGAGELLEALLVEAPHDREVRLVAARLAMEERNFSLARELLEQALAASQKEDALRLRTYALLAACDHLDGRAQSPWTQKALAQNPRYGELYAIDAYFQVIRRQYREAVALYLKAVELDPELWSAHAALGINLLRVNRFDQARRHLELAYTGNPFSAETVNTLRLLDSLDHFQVTTVRRQGQDITLRLHRDEADVLSPYVLELVERSVKRFTERYRFHLQHPVVVELYPHPEDFAVRTAGMPGIGILGATFGYVVAMESPSARGYETEFDWASALWHEMAHVFTLEATAHQVPRWFSEGISVFEEWTSGPTPLHAVPPSFLRAVHEELLLPVDKLDQGFIRPTYPDQVGVSYVQSGLICQFIEETWGIDALVNLLYQFDGRTSDAKAIEGAIGISSEAFDSRFLAYVDERFASVASSLESWQTLLQRAGAAAEDGRFDDAVDLADEARFIYPEYVGVHNAYLILADAHEALGQTSAALAIGLEYWRRGGREPQHLARLAAALSTGGDAKDAIDVLRSAVWVKPLDGDLHARLGVLLLDDGQVQEAAREFEALLATDPHDKAAAHYQLAQAYDRLGAAEKARMHLLDSLEIAPSYRPAQKLLLEISRRHE